MRIVIGEDSALFRAGLRSFLTEVGHEVVADGHDAPSALEAVRRHRPDLAVLDIRMPPDHADDGARVAARIRDELPDTGVVLLSQHVESRLSVDLVAAGRFGYLLKDRVLDVDDFLAALERVHAGGSALDPEVVARLMLGGSSALSSLTAREREVLALMAEGLTNTGIADRLVLTDRTVETHVSRILHKLGLGEATTGEHRRVLAVLRHLEEHRAG
ncbi:LuxR family transcriptional regulator [Knoellia sinensis KCTC 19936]|uniref:LuxR family transcriptional regulator n=1 Tax=Knoellia sinensis KCTC 19936 TaxID=1385520 RepID=A0A0A0J221_9MICO|nr:response regulator transcription factor [Knoellia sinensis]KGN29696.1 LuxR family transcriptional regulator [Knoellia sinensis KCTC 19936]